MADNKSGRDKQAHDERRRQDERDMLEQRERADETEPPVEVETLVELDRSLEDLSFPATATEVREAAGDWEFEADGTTYTVEQLVPATDQVVMEQPSDVRVRLQRPTIAATMTQIVAAIEELPDTEFRPSQQDAYEKTLRALRQIDADDDDEGLDAIREWIVSYIDEKERVPGSREVRREGAKFCRANGYQVRNDEWLGI